MADDEPRHCRESVVMNLLIRAVSGAAASRKKNRDNITQVDVQK
eukprot:XP_001704932.1 Hypothetical protein GL50803_3072 [Giardia lamblia ATCC 50803]